MSTNIFTSLCQDDCDEVLLPAIDEDQDCTGFDTFLSEICGILIVNQEGTLPGDWKDKSAWEAIVDNSLSDVNAAKYISGIGGMPAPDKVTRTLAKHKSITVKRTYTLTFNIQNMSDLNYAFLRFLQCGDTNYRVWLETIDGSIFGGPNGICLIFSDADLPLEEGNEAFESGVITMQFDAKVDPERTKIINLSENFASGNVTPTNRTVFGTGPTDVWGTSENDVWGINS